MIILNGLNRLSGLNRLKRLNILNILKRSQFIKTFKSASIGQISILFFTLAVSVNLYMTITVKFLMTLPVTVQFSGNLTRTVQFSLTVTTFESTCNRTQRRMMVDRIKLNMSCQIETCLILANKLASVVCTQLLGGVN